MADEAKKGILGDLAALFQQWQVVVAAIAAATALWFGFDDQRRKQLDLNRAAVDEAKDAEHLAAFRADPHSTLVEFRATYPEHAFCAALGYYVAEAGRLADDETARASVKPIGDAIGAQIERLAAQGGSSLDALQTLAVAAAGDGGAASDCPRLGPDLAWYARPLMWTDCRLLLATFAQAQCQAEATRLAAAALAPPPPEAVVLPDGWIGMAPTPPSPSAEPTPQVAPPAPATDEPAPTMALGPGDACGAAPPTVFIQFVAEADRPRAAAARDLLLAAGWPVAEGLDLVAAARTAGDVRFYWPEQAACAARLAEALGSAFGSPFATLSLAGRYRNLPRGRVEVWLPAA
ncbi:hypothetical protein [Amaricoccus sp.]|uniref:hypothetical protein n=1 Tax=Amaricoccus sp. TaxID=1872485 RepID=UPI001B3E0795|nr:hypothetical protein [Amaricoccus sp.]MBP7240396.1 hypothetical protein [Amaricoccus sp.]